MNFFENLLKTFIDRYASVGSLSCFLTDRNLNPIYSRSSLEKHDEKLIDDIRDMASNMTQPKIFFNNGYSTFIIPVNIMGQNEYFILSNNSNISFDAGNKDVRLEKDAAGRLKSINFLFYFLNMTLKSICQELQTKDYFRKLSGIIEFEDVSHDKEKLNSKIESILNSMVSITGSSLAILHILDPNTNKLRINNAAGNNYIDILSMDIGTDKEYITSLVWSKKEIARLRPGEEDQKNFKLMEKCAKTDVKGYLGVPIRAKDEYFGVFELYRLDSDIVYSAEDEYCAQVIANFISVLHKNYVYLYQEKNNREQLQAVNRDLKKTQQDLNAFVLRVSNLYKINKVIRSVIDLDEMIKKLIDVIGKATESDEVFIFLKDEKTYELVLQGCPKEYISSVGFVRIPFGKGIEGIVAQTKMSIIVAENVINDPRYDSVLDLELKFFNSLLAAPIMIKDKVIGVLELRNETKKEYTASEKKLISAITDQLGIAIENAQLHKKTELLSLTDDMTGLFNFRFFQQKLKDEIIRSKRYQRDLSILMLDIDHFKQVNDTYGHTKGDFVLKKVSEVITFTVRDVDISSRYGGEEFVVILPETEQRDTLLIAERIRKRVEEIDMSGEEGLENLKITISIGVASFPENAATEKSLIEAADKALYLAKRTGRNRVVGYSSL